MASVQLAEEFEGVRLTPSLRSTGSDRAVAVLQAYFAPVGQGKDGFTGGAWDTFDPSGTRAISPNIFTADDILSSSLLSTPIDPRAALQLILTRRPRFESLLEQIGPDLEFVRLESTEEGPFRAVRTLYRELMTLPGIGETRATKLLARKRPLLVPIVDSVLVREVFRGRDQHWAPLHQALRAHERALWNHLVDLRSRAGIPEAVSPLRVFDVLAWMDGTGNSDRVLEGEAISTPDPSISDPKD
ncbi:DUF6308 family protein [Ornithinimicrobium sp. Y1694]|uniref:DUF6308 family protein n=1 Tax=Ornithinimicrobium sp. Y1694 TaxID=3418590 RepID=UPI003CE8245A